MALNSNISTKPALSRAFKKKGLETRMRLLKVAEAEFAKNGVGQTSLDDIASAALVAKGTLYQYFSGKDEIYQELKDAFFGKLESFLGSFFTLSAKSGLRGAQIVSGVPSLEPRNRLEMRQFLTRFFASLCQFYTDEGNAFRFFLGEEFRKAPEVARVLTILEHYIDKQRARALVKSSVGSPVLSQVLLVVWIQLLNKWSSQEQPRLFGITHTDEFVGITLDLLKIDS